MKFGSHWVENSFDMQINNSFFILVGKTLVNLMRKKKKKKDNLRMDHREVYCKDMRWLDLAQYRMQCQDLVLAMLSHVLYKRVTLRFLFHVFFPVKALLRHVYDICIISSEMNTINI
jgi:hypothetical protein